MLVECLVLAYCWGGGESGGGPSGTQDPRRVDSKSNRLILFEDGSSALTFNLFSLYLAFVLVSQGLSVPVENLVGVMAWL